MCRWPNSLISKPPSVQFGTLPWEQLRGKNPDFGADIPDPHPLSRSLGACPDITQRFHICKIGGPWSTWANVGITVLGTQHVLKVGTGKKSQRGHGCLTHRSKGLRGLCSEGLGQLCETLSLTITTLMLRDGDSGSSLVISYSCVPVVTCL